MFIRTVALSCLLGLCLFGTAWGADYYVATTGNDTTGDGSIGNPWATINKGLTGRLAGDVVNVAAGSYSGSITMNIGAGVSLVGAGSGSTTYTYTSPGTYSYVFTGNIDATYNTLVQGINFNSTGIDGGFISFGSSTLTTTKLVVQDVVLQNFLVSGTGRIFNFNPMRSELQLVDVDMLNNTGGAFFRYRNFLDPPGTGTPTPHTITINGGTWTGNTQNVFDANYTVTGLLDLSIDGLTYTGNTKDFSLFGTTQGNVNIQNSIFGGNAGTVGLNMGTLDAAAVVSVLNNEFKDSTTGLSMTGTPTTPVTIKDNTFTNTTTGAQGGGATDAYDYWASNTFTNVTTDHAGFNTVPAPVTAVLGDLNDDSVVNNQDIAPFVLALTDLPTWQAAYPGVNILDVGDINGDTEFNNQDIAPFVTLLTGGGTSLGAGEVNAVPEPASLGLLAIGGLMLISRRRRA